MQTQWLNYLLSFVWFFITATLISILLNLWGNPISFEWTSSIATAFTNSLIIFFAPAILFASAWHFNKKEASITFGAVVVFLCIEFFVLITTMFDAESALGLFYAYGYIGVALIFSVISGALTKRLFGQQPSIAKLSLLFIIPFVVFVLIVTRINAYQDLTAEECANLDVYGQIYCYERLAEQMNDPVWCYAITAADNIVENCVQKLQSITINPLECQKLPYDESRQACILESMTKIGDLAGCEEQGTVSVGGCILNIIKAQEGKGTTDCSVLQNERNKISCYREWQMIESRYVESYKQCDRVGNLSERDLCIFSGAYQSDGGGTTSVATKASWEKVCKSIVSADLRDRCLKSLDKYKTF